MKTRFTTLDLQAILKDLRPKYEYFMSYPCVCMDGCMKVCMKVCMKICMYGFMDGCVYVKFHGTKVTVFDASFLNW